MFWCRPAVASLALILVVTTAPGRNADNPWIRGVYTGSSPRPVPAALEDAWQKASELAEQTPGAFVLVGSGRSMQPLYNPGTILVLRQATYEELQRGQTVLYRNRTKKVIAHVLVTKARDGWRAQGVNNRSHDLEPVLADNLVGVVVAAFQPVGLTPPGQFAVVR